MTWPQSQCRLALTPGEAAPRPFVLALNVLAHSHLRVSQSGLCSRQSPMNPPGRIVGRRSIGHPADAGSEYEPGCGHQQHSGDTRLPCAGAGVGVFFTHTNGFGGARSDSGNAMPCFSGQAACGISSPNMWPSSASIRTTVPHLTLILSRQAESLSEITRSAISWVDFPSPCSSHGTKRMKPGTSG